MFTKYCASSCTVIRVQDKIVNSREQVISSLFVFAFTVR
jgi:hypothetical protein